MRSLSLSANDIRDPGARAIFQSLTNNTSLIELDLSVNQITRSGVEDCPIMGPDTMCCLQLLSMSSNSLGDSGVQEIGQMMSRGGSWLRCVRLNDNGDITLDTIKLLSSVEEDRGFGWQRERVLWIASVQPQLEGSLARRFSELSTHVMHILIRFCERSVRFTYDNARYVEYDVKQDTSL